MTFTELLAKVDSLRERVPVDADNVEVVAIFGDFSCYDFEDRLEELQKDNIQAGGTFWLGYTAPLDLAAQAIGIPEDVAEKAIYAGQDENHPDADNQDLLYQLTAADFKKLKSKRKGYEHCGLEYILILRKSGG